MHITWSGHKNIFMAQATDDIASRSFDIQYVIRVVLSGYISRTRLCIELYEAVFSIIAYIYTQFTMLTKL